MDTVIKNGTVVNAFDIFKADIGIQNGKIVALGEDLTGEENIDATGKYVLPGMIDVHTHFEVPFVDTRSIDNFFTGTRSAACGGVTTIIDVAIQGKGESLNEAISNRRKLADPQVVIDYGLHLCITHLEEETLEQIAEAVNGGIPTLELYMAAHDPLLTIDDGQLWGILSEVANCGGLVGVHCENAAILEYLIQQYMVEDKNTPEYYPLLHPAFSEAESTHRAITFSQEVKSSLYLFDLSCRNALNQLTLARNSGANAYGSTAPHYLTHTVERYKTLDARNYVTFPPLREEQDIKSLWKGIHRGDIQVVSSGHCAFTSEQKKLGESLTDIPVGLAGVETLLPVMYNEGVVGKRIDLMQLVSLLSTNPAKIFGLQNKGVISVGKDADLVIFNPMEKKMLTASILHTECDYTVYEGLEIQGYPEITIAKGTIVFDRGKFSGEQGAGNFIERKL